MSDPISPSEANAATQVILLGASNVTIGFGPISGMLRSGFSTPLDVRAAIGHGRSYGVWSRFAGRSLPGISECGLWPSLREPRRSRHALLTDIGNDLLYGHSAAQIAGWVESCLARLLDAQADCILTRLPLARIERLSASRYHATRLLFFPRHRPVRWREMLDRARELDARVTSFADAAGVPVITPAGDWYGIDPIHIRRGIRPAAWREIFSAWPDFSGSTASRQPGLRLMGRFPEQYRFLGVPRSSRQPVCSQGGVSLSLY